MAAALAPHAVVAGHLAPHAAANGAWTVYHHDNAHTGYDPTAPAAGSVAPTSTWTEATLDEQVYGEPLIYNGLVYAATLNNTVYALDQATGAIVWSKNLGAPVGGGWDCGNVSPQGILGTPVIDATAGRIYVAALFNSDDLYHLVGLNLVSGAVALSTAINIPVSFGAFDWKTQQERGALALGSGYVYVPFGGRDGDCSDSVTGPYHGWVVGVPTSGSTTVAVYRTASDGAGVWGAGGVVVDDATGNVFAATGNGLSCNAVDQNDAVVRLSPTLALQDYFMPSDWQNNWCANDQDLGSAGPVLLSSSLLFQAGKWGDGFLLNPNSLGGVGGQKFRGQVCFGNQSDATFGSFAYAAPFVYVECENHGLVALNVNTGTPSFSVCDATCAAPTWHSTVTPTFGPPIVAGGAVWVVDTSGGNGLYAFNATTGAQIYNSGGFSTNRFETPAEAGGQVFVGAGNVIKSFTFGPSGPSVSSVMPNTGPAAGGTSVTIAGTNFTGATAVKFGTASATFTVTDASHIATTSPTGSGVVDVTVTTPNGTTPTSAADHFTYTGPPPTVSSVVPSTGPASGGTSVTIAGANFTGATAVKFGTATATFTVTDSTHIAATSPAGSGTVDVTVTTPSGTSSTSAADQFTYVAPPPPPTVSSVAPNSGLTSGGTSVTVTGSNFTGATAVKFGTASATFTVTDASHIAATSPPGSGTVDVTVTTPNGTSATSAADQFTYTTAPTAYTALSPNRLLDTRLSAQTLGPGASLNLTVTGGTTGVPANATSVVLNVTATNTTAPSYLTVFPSGAARPTASNLNWVAGRTVPNLVSVQVGNGGQVTFFNAFGSVDVVVDLEGYFAAPSGNAGGFISLTPARITDTRAGSGQPNAGATLGPNATLDVQVRGAGNVPASGVSGAVLNVTVTNTSAYSYLTVWPKNATRPTASNLNWVPGQTVPNRVFVPIDPTTGKISVYNSAGSTDVVVDVSGFFTDASLAGKLFTAMSPVRILDTRNGGTLGPGGTLPLRIGGNNGVPATAAGAMVNVTVTNTFAPSFLTVYPCGAVPNASDLNWVPGQTIANLVAAPLNTGSTCFYNQFGSVDVVVDLSGYFN